MARSPGSDAPFGVHLRRLRNAAGLTQEALAERAGLSLNAISALERGERRHPYSRTVQVLAEALGLADAERIALAATATRHPDAADPHPHARAPLPEPPTSLVGRQEEIARGVDVLRQGNVRLLTLTGPGGVGKTRLALRIAQELEAAFADGVAFVPLASVMDPVLVIPVIAQAVGLQGAPGTGPRELLARHLEDQHLLLVLDNVEQVVVAAVELAGLLAMCPRLTMLVTSRISLRIDGEHLFPVPPLPVHAPETTSSGTEIAGVPAVQLFVQRAQAVRPGFVLTPDNRGAVAGICARLDGIPLAIELAAAWVRVLSPQAMLGNLGNRLAMLTGGGRDRPERLQTMRAAIEWSYGHLPPAEQMVFRCLAVCAGGCELETAAAIVQGAGETGPAGLDEAGHRPIQAIGGSPFLVSLATLVDHSLVHLAEGPDGESRVGMLETIRDYGLEELAANGDEAGIRHAHAMSFLQRAAGARADIEGPARRSAHARIERELDNVRAAMVWLHGRGEAELAQRLANEMARFWIDLGYISEGRAWMEQVVAMTGPSPARIRVEALYWAAGFANLQDAVDRADEHAGTALALARADDDRVGAAGALTQRAEAIASTEIERAQALAQEALTIFRAEGERIQEGMTLRQLGIFAHRQGDHERAAAYHHAALELWRQLDHPWGVPAALRELADGALARGDLATAQAQYQESLARWRLLGERLHMSDCLRGLARVALATSGGETAVLLLSALTRLDREMGYVHSGDPGEHLVEQARSVAGAARFDELWRRGQTRSLDAVLDDVMTMPPPA